MDFYYSDNDFSNLSEVIDDARMTLPENQNSFKYWFGRAENEFCEFCLVMAALLAQEHERDLFMLLCGHYDFWMSLDEAGFILIETGVLPHEKLNGWLTNQEAVHKAADLENQMDDWE